MSSADEPDRNSGGIPARAQYRDFLAGDLEHQLQELSDSWLQGMRRAPLRWRVESVEVEIKISKLELATAAGQPHLAEVVPLPRPADSASRNDTATTDRDLVKSCLARRGEARVSEITQDLTVAGSDRRLDALHKLLSRMVEEGVISRVGRGRYALADRAD